jgi:hypothetical protein
MRTVDPGVEPFQPSATEVRGSLVDNANVNDLRVVAAGQQ